MDTVSLMVLSALYEKSEFPGSGRSMVASLKREALDGRAPPGVKLAAQFDSTREIKTRQGLTDSVVVHGRSLLMECLSLCLLHPVNDRVFSLSGACLVEWRSELLHCGTSSISDKRVW